MGTEVEVSKGGAVEKRATTLGIIKGYVSSEEIKKRFSEVLGSKAPTFLGSIVSLVSSNTNFNGVDPNTIMASALVAATLDLPINPSLGFAYIIPYGNKAQFQLGAKGVTQLALRTGQYKLINTTEIYAGELVSQNRLTGEIVIDIAKRTSDEVIGYAAFFRLLNSFEKTLYMTVDEVLAHGKKYSKSFSNKNAPWQTDFDGMAKKTVIKLLLSKFGILSVEMQRAIEVDQAVLKNDGKEIEYIDNDNAPSKVEDAVLEVESAGVVAKPEAEKTKDVVAQPVEEKKVSEPVEAQPKHKSEKEILSDLMDGLNAITSIEELQGWKGMNNDLIQGLKTQPYAMVTGLIVEKEQEFAKAGQVEKAPVVETKPEPETKEPEISAEAKAWLGVIDAARLETSLHSMVGRVVADLNAKKITKDERNILIEAINTKLEEIVKKKAKK
jgi:recombination protein RecT